MITRVGLIGLGTMGPGIAARLARGGLSLNAFDTAPEAVERARGLVDLANGVMDQLGIAQPPGGAGENEKNKN